SLTRHHLTVYADTQKERLIMVMGTPVKLADDASGFVGSPRFHEVKTATHDHLLGRIEELGAEFGRWSRSAIQQFVNIEVDSFVRLRRLALNEAEVRQLAEALTKELAGLGPLEDLLEDPAVEDIL